MFFNCLCSPHCFTQCHSRNIHNLLDLDTYKQGLCNDTHPPTWCPTYRGYSQQRSLFLRGSLKIWRTLFFILCTHTNIQYISLLCVSVLCLHVNYCFVFLHIKKKMYSLIKYQQIDHFHYFQFHYLGTKVSLDDFLGDWICQWSL